MDLPPPRKKISNGRIEDAPLPKSKRPYVRWIATFVGVLMVAIGILLVLWSFAWMAAPEPGPLRIHPAFRAGPA